MGLDNNSGRCPWRKLLFLLSAGTDACSSLSRGRTLWKLPAPGSEGHTLPLGRWVAACTPVLSPSEAFLDLMIKGHD